MQCFEDQLLHFDPGLKELSRVEAGTGTFSLFALGLGTDIIKIGFQLHTDRKSGLSLV
ncbi:Uncharacterized protein DAT39_006909, partial [Clarias magur]